MSTERFRALLAAMAILACSAGIAACGDDDEGGDGGDAADLALIEDGTLTVASDIPYPPFEEGDPPDYEGFDIDFANEVAERLDLEVKIVDTPFDPILQGGNGRFDLAFSAISIDDEREQAVDFSDPYFLSEQSLLVNTEGKVKTAADLGSDSVIGVQDATTGEQYAEENYGDADIRPFPEIDDAYTALENGQVDAVLNDLFSTQSVESETLKVAEVFKTGELYGILFPEESDALREAVNEAVAEIKEDGTLSELYQEYFEKDAPQQVLDATHEPK